MIAITALTLVYWALAVLSVTLGCVYQLVRIDKARHAAVPADVNRVAESFGPIWSTPARRLAPLFADQRHEFVVKLSQAARHIHKGDLLKFSGRSLFAWLIRIVRYTDTSHVGLVDEDEDGTLYIIDSCEGVGVTRKPLWDAVCAHPGQWSWGVIAADLEHRYNRDATIKYARTLAANKTKYGYVGIALLGCVQVPVLRELVYLLQLHRLPIYNATPFCAQFDVDALRIGGLDVVPRRPSQLVAPQDISQSMAVDRWIALVP